jgi:hypothetical protein
MASEEVEGGLQEGACGVREANRDSSVFHPDCARLPHHFDCFFDSHVINKPPRQKV